MELNCINDVGICTLCAGRCEEVDSEEISGEEVDDDGRIYKNPRNSPSAFCPRDEELAELLVSTLLSEIKKLPLFNVVEYPTENILYLLKQARRRRTL